jgi:hypothetical protein
MRDGIPTAEIEWLYGLQHFGIKLGLDNIRGLLDALDHPERAYPSVLIAGTNGKGSVAAMLHAMLGAAGLQAGLFTSPHLVRPNERIRIGAREIDDDELGRQLNRMRETIEAAVEHGNLETHPSFRSSPQPRCNRSETTACEPRRSRWGWVGGSTRPTPSTGISRSSSVSISTTRRRSVRRWSESPARRAGSSSRASRW